MQILTDYLVFTSKIHSLENLLEMLGIHDVDFTPIRSYYGYSQCLYYGGIKFHLGGRDEVCLDMSGTGCRTLEFIHNNEFDWFGLFDSLKDSIISGDVHIARLDIACDEFEGLLSYDRLVKYSKLHKYVCKSKVKPYWTDGREQAIYFGSSKSDRRLRIYNKALEQGYDDDTHWIRTEFQFRNDSALSFLLNWYKVKDIGDCFHGVLIDYLRFVTMSVDDMTGQNYSRLETARWWKKFCDNAQGLKQMYLQGRKYDLSNVYSYVEKFCSSNLKTLLKANGGDLSELIEIIDKAKLNKRQEIALAEYKKG